MTTEYLSENEAIHERTKNDFTLDLARELSKYIQNWNITRNDKLEVIRKDRIGYLQLVSEVRNELKDYALSKALEQRLFVDFKEELEKQGLTPEKSPYVKRFYELGMTLHDYNLSLLERADYKESLFCDLLNKKPNVFKKCDLSRDGLNNIYKEEYDEQQIFGTKQSLIEHFKLEKNMAREIYNTKETVYYKNNAFKKIDSNIEKLQKIEENPVLIVHLNYDGEMRIYDEDETIKTLEDNLKIMDKKQRAYEEEM